MKIRIFQINHDKDSNKLAFMNYDYAQAHGGVDSSIYRQIYGGTVNCKSLESVFCPLQFGQNTSRILRRVDVRF